MLTSYVHLLANGFFSGRITQVYNTVYIGDPSILSAEAGLCIGDPLGTRARQICSVKPATITIY